MTSGTGHAVFPGHQGRYRLPRRDSSELLLRGLELPLAAQLHKAPADLSCSPCGAPCKLGGIAQRCAGPPSWRHARLFLPAPHMSRKRARGGIRCVSDWLERDRGLDYRGSAAPCCKWRRLSTQDSTTRYSSRRMMAVDPTDPTDPTGGRCPLGPAKRRNDGSKRKHVAPSQPDRRA